MSRTEVLPGPGDVVRIRASSLSELFDDALRWKAKALDGESGRVFGRSHLGTAIHFGTAYFDNERIIEDGKPDVETAVDKFLEMLHDDENVHWLDIAKAQAEAAGTALVTRYCQEVSEQFEFVGVEVLCEPVEIEMSNGIILELTGTADRIYVRKKRYGVMDLKSGARIINQAGDIDAAVHSAQLAQYELLTLLAAKTTGFSISLPAIVMALNVSTGKIQWCEVPETRNLLFGADGNMGYLEAASRIIASQLYIGNPRSQLCSDKYCPIYPCFYRIEVNDGD